MEKAKFCIETTDGVQMSTTVEGSGWDLTLLLANAVGDDSRLEAVVEMALAAVKARRDLVEGGIEPKDVQEALLTKLKGMSGMAEA